MEDLPKPEIYVSPRRMHSEGPGVGHEIGPFIELDRQGLSYLDSLIRGNPAGAHEFIDELMAALLAESELA